MDQITSLGDFEKREITNNVDQEARVRVTESLNLFQGRDRTRPSDALGKGRAKQPKYLALQLDQSILWITIINIYLLRLQF